jgi:hypothetical protein
MLTNLQIASQGFGEKIHRVASKGLLRREKDGRDG